MPTSVSRRVIVSGTRGGRLGAGGSIGILAKYGTVPNTATY